MCKTIYLFARRAAITRLSRYHGLTDQGLGKIYRCRKFADTSWAAEYIGMR
jgi:hypothetical protein